MWPSQRPCLRALDPLGSSPGPAAAIALSTPHAFPDVSGIQPGVTGSGGGESEDASGKVCAVPSQPSNLSPSRCQLCPTTDLRIWVSPGSLGLGLPQSLLGLAHIISASGEWPRLSGDGRWGSGKNTLILNNPTPKCPGPSSSAKHRTHSTFGG